MSTFFVSRHSGALQWAAQQGIRTEGTQVTANFDPATVQAGDVVIGTLPVHLVAEVCRKGASYQHLVLDIPPQWRGMDLSIEQMHQCQARLEEYQVVVSGARQLGSTTALPKRHIQFCIASDQLEANYMAAAQLRPQRVYILTSASPHIKDAAARLADALATIDIPSEIIEDLPDSDPFTLREFAFTLTATVRGMMPDMHLLLNASGGKKVMSFALSQAFMATADSSVIYVDSGADELQVLSPWGVPSKPLLPDLIEIDSALALRGYRITQRETDDYDWRTRAINRGALSNWLVQKVSQLGGFISALNYTAAHARGVDTAVPFCIAKEQPFNLNEQARQAMARIVEAGLLQWDQRAKTLRFADENARQYLNGRWLEEFTWLVLRKIEGGDCAGGIKIESRSSRAVDNEIDFVVAWHNRLFMVECKTKNMKQQDVGNQELYRIDSLQKQLGGYFATSLLISTRELDPPAEQRARQNRVIILSGANIVHLREVALMWQQGESVAVIQAWIDQRSTERP